MTILNLPHDDTSFELANDTETNTRWKRILPMNKTIVYGGQKLTFDKTLMERLKANYDAKVLDQTAFQLATDSNSHDTLDDLKTRRNFDPERFRGDIRELRIVEDKGDEKDGFWAKVNLTPEGVKAVDNNPNLGVSPSIKPDYVDAQGNKHDFVLRHLVGTLDPKVKGMGAWGNEDILLTSDKSENEEVYSLTSVAPTTTDGVNENVTVKKEDYEKLQKQVNDFAKGPELLDAILAEKDVDDVKLSNDEDSKTKDDPRITEMQNRMAKAEWNTQRERFKNAGVPNKMLNLCDEVMSVYEAPVINLSNDKTVDPKETLLAVLKEAEGTVDLSSEEGHGMSVDERDAANTHAKQSVEGFMKEFYTDLF